VQRIVLSPESRSVYLRGVPSGSGRVILRQEERAVDEVTLRPGDSVSAPIFHGRATYKLRSIRADGAIFDVSGYQTTCSVALCARPFTDSIRVRKPSAAAAFTDTGPSPSRAAMYGASPDCDPRMLIAAPSGEEPGG
jgi:hypothetical protein